MKEKDLLEKILKLVKVIMFLLLGILLVLIIGVSKLYVSSNSKEDAIETESSNYNTDYDVSTFKEISAKNIEKETKGKLSVLYIGRESCGWCAAFLPNLWNAQDEYGFTTLYVDLAKIIDFNKNTITDEEAYNVLLKLTGDKYDGYMEENLGATPMILVMKDNKIISAQTGYSEYEAFETVLADAGLEKK